jgi:amino acid transporter
MPADPVSAGPRGNLPGVDRLLALSDGVVAIAITLLVLQLNVPSPAALTDPDSASELAAHLSKGADQLVSYVISFYVIAQFWFVHHRVFRRITGQQEGLAWWNFAFLFTITIMPFTSDLLGKFPPTRSPSTSSQLTSCLPSRPASPTAGPAAKPTERSPISVYYVSGSGFLHTGSEPISEARGNDPRCLA